MTATERAMIRRSRPNHRRQPGDPHLAILVQKLPAGGADVHAGIARGAQGVALCNDRLLLPVWGHAAQAEGFELFRADGWRHRWAEAYLELNRGCEDCLNVLAQIGREAGWATPRELET